MRKIMITDAVISKGYNDNPALRFNENGDNKFARFRIGVSVYDKNADKNRRFVNMTVKAFGGTASRIESMKLNAGKYVNIVGRYDEEFWEDQTTKEKKSAPVLIIDEIEYCSNGSGKQNSDENGTPAAGNGNPSPGGNGSEPSSSSQTTGGFTGFESFGGENPYFPAG